MKKKVVIKNEEVNSIGINKDGNPEMTAYINDESDDSKNRQVEVKVKADCRGIYIQAKGYETDFDDTPIMLEIWNNELRLIIWGEKKMEDPSQIINLEGLRKKSKKKS